MLKHEYTKCAHFNLVYLCRNWCGFYWISSVHLQCWTPVLQKCLVSAEWNCNVLIDSKFFTGTEGNENFCVNLYMHMNFISSNYCKSVLAGKLNSFVKIWEAETDTKVICINIATAIACTTHITEIRLSTCLWHFLQQKHLFRCKRILVIGNLPYWDNKV